MERGRGAVRERAERGTVDPAADQQWQWLMKGDVAVEPPRDGAAMA
jgi:hypothetical protein